MADNYLEYHRDEYEKRKALWLKNKGRAKRVIQIKRDIKKPDDEAL